MDDGKLPMSRRFIEVVREQERRDLLVGEVVFELRYRRRGHRTAELPTRGGS